ncbi:hypothetical protein EYS14_12145 [Alteromonadaceae bacterium M269]|nr:hypothetical protein EYS14_12145 [Alteromonadaceae bacterium M269]
MRISMFVSICRIKTFVLLALIFSFAAIGRESDERELLSPEHIKADLSQLYAELQLAHYNLFFNLPKKQYDLAYQRYLEDIDSPMSASDIKVMFQKFMALGNIAHSNTSLPVEAYQKFVDKGGRTLPFYVAIEDGEVWISDYYGNETSIALYDQVLAINDIPIGELLKRLGVYLSADNIALESTLMEFQLPFLMWLELGEVAQYRLRVQSSNGHTHNAIIAALNRNEQSKNRSSQETDSADEPSIQQADMLEGNIAYLKPGPFYNTTSENIWDNTAFVEFIDNAFNDFIEKGAKALLIDLRSNPGGTNSFSDPMIAWFANKPFKFASDFIVKVSPQSERANEKRLAVSTDKNDISNKLATFYKAHEAGETFSFDLPLASPREGKRFSAPVYLLIDRYTYSNAVSVAAIAQDYGFATLIGEKTSDLATTLGAMEHFTLENSGIEIGYPKAHIIRPNGSRKPDGVKPDVLLEISLRKNKNGMMLEQALDVIKAAISE